MQVFQVSRVDPYSNIGASFGNIANAFRDEDAAPSGPIATAATFATDNKAAIIAAQVGDLAIPLILAGQIDPEKIPFAPIGRAGTIGGSVTSSFTPLEDQFLLMQCLLYGDAGLTGYDALKELYDDLNDANQPLQNDFIPCE